jgi:sulfite reductase (NADPH) flavoprotein alpha-component
VTPDGSQVPFSVNFFPFLQGLSRHRGVSLGETPEGKKAKMANTTLHDQTAGGRTTAPGAAAPVRILYGTHTGTSQMLAQETARYLQQAGTPTIVTDMESFDPGDLPGLRRLVIIVSTDGDGEPPLMAEGLLEYLRGAAAPRLPGLRYGVVALGDTRYYRFCQAGRDFDTELRRLGAARVMERQDLDTDYEDGFQKWLLSVPEALG